MPPSKKYRVTRATATKYSKRKRTADVPILVSDNLIAAPGGEIVPPKPTKKKGRGLGRMRPVKANPEDRPEVWRVGQHEFSCELANNPRLITTTITKLALRLMPAPLRSYHSFDKTVKNSVERDFLVRFFLRLIFYFQLKFFPKNLAPKYYPKIYFLVRFLLVCQLHS